jgi:uncharacterized membrane protein
MLGLKPFRATLTGILSSVIVSPTLQSLTCFIPAVINPICPCESFSEYFILGVKKPHFSTGISCLCP